MNEEKKKWLRSESRESVYDFVSSLITALTALAFIFLFLFRMVQVDGESMRNTLQNADRLIMVSFRYTPERGDIVVIRRDEEEPLIKRIIALPGDTIDISAQTGQVILNGKVLDEPYILGDFTPVNAFVGPYTVPKGKVFVMGDNRRNSLDSRSFGAFSIEDLEGKAVFRIFPFNKIGTVELKSDENNE